MEFIRVHRFGDVLTEIAGTAGSKNALDLRPISPHLATNESQGLSFLVK